jgi:hypothetical protein
MASRETKVVRSYRLVFRRRWRIFRIGNWRLPLPGGLELRLIGYWLICLATIAALSRLPLLRLPLTAMPPALRLLATPLLGAWALCRTEPDGRPPHRALLGLAAWRLRPRVVAAGRSVPAVGAEISPLETLVLDPDLQAAEYPRGRIEGPAQLLLRYPVAARRGRRTLRLCRRPGPALHMGQVIEIPSGRAVAFEERRR